MWYVVYKTRNSSKRLLDDLTKKGIEYYVPMHYTERINKEGTMMMEVQEASVNNIIFIQSKESILLLVRQIEWLLSPMKDTLTNMPVTIPDAEMEHFIKIQQTRPNDVFLLKDPYSKFAGKTKVRVKAGLFEGIEGRIVRIRRDRKLVISLGIMAVAISGIHFSLLEPIP